MSQNRLAREGEVRKGENGELREAVRGGGRELK